MQQSHATLACSYSAAREIWIDAEILIWRLNEPRSDRRMTQNGLKTHTQPLTLASHQIPSRLLGREVKYPSHAIFDHVTKPSRSIWNNL